MYQRDIAATTKRTQRYKCPVHHGKNRSVAVWWNNGPRAFCHSHQCSQTEILDALGITNSQSIPWTPPPPRPRPTISAKPLTPVSPTQALDYLKGIGGHPPALESPINAMMANAVSIGATRTSGATQESLATAGNYGGLTRWTRPAPRPLL